LKEQCKIKSEHVLQSLEEKQLGAIILASVLNNNQY